MSFLMTYNMINFPNPQEYKKSLSLMLQKNVDYIEIQLPFSNPLADGPLIHKAHQKSLQYPFDFFLEIAKIASLKKQLKSTSKLVLMSYITPIFHFGLSKVLDYLKQNDFEGLIVPDMPVGSPEQDMVANQCERIGLQWIPLISPLTNENRLQKIKKYLQKDQLVYATARKGKTGSETDFESQEIKIYFEFLKQNLQDYQILIGFGIKKAEQVKKLNQQGFLVVVASELIRRIEEQKEDQSTKVVNDFLIEFS